MPTDVVLAAKDHAQRGALSQTGADGGGSRRLGEVAVRLLVVGVETNDARVPIECPVPTRGPALEATPRERPAFSLEPEARRGRCVGLACHQLHDTRQGVGAVEAARGAPHHLDAVQLEGELATEVEGSPGLVDGHAVHEDAGEVGSAAPHEDAGLKAEAPRACHRDAGNVLEQVDEVRRLAGGDRIAVEHRGAHAEGREGRVAPRGGDHDVLPDRRRRQDDVEARFSITDGHPRLVVQHQARCAG